MTGFCYARLTGREALGLLPLPYTLRLLNLPDSGTGLLYAARNLSVLRDGSLLAWGRVSAVLRRTVPEGTLMEVVFSLGLPLWEGNPAEDPGRFRNGDLPPGLYWAGSCPHPGPGLLRPGGGMRGGGALRCTCPGLPQPGRPAGDPGGRPAGEPVSDGTGPDRRSFLYRRADDPADHRDRLACGGKNLRQMERRVRGGTRHRTQDGY